MYFEMSFLHNCISCIIRLTHTITICCLDSGVTAISDAFFGVGSGPVLLEGLSCIGNETNLLQCTYAGAIGSSNCAHILDASVVCERRQSK